MKVSVKKDDKVVDIELLPIKGRECRAGWELLSKLQKTEEGDEAEAGLKYRSWRDGIASRISGFSVEELDDLDIDEKLKITSYVDEKLKADLGFTKL